MLCNTQAGHLRVWYTGVSRTSRNWMMPTTNSLMILEEFLYYSIGLATGSEITPLCFNKQKQQPQSKTQLGVTRRDLAPTPVQQLQQRQQQHQAPTVSSIHWRHNTTYRCNVKDARFTDTGSFHMLRRFFLLCVFTYHYSFHIYAGFSYSVFHISL